MSLNAFSSEFDGKECKVERANFGSLERIDVFYGGLLSPDGVGRGHVVSNDGVNIQFWKTPEEEGGRIKINNSFSSEKLSSHMQS